jgi:hypothetical protein
MRRLTDRKTAKAMYAATALRPARGCGRKHVIGIAAGAIITTMYVQPWNSARQGHCLLLPK